MAAPSLDLFVVAVVGGLVIRLVALLVLEVKLARSVRSVGNKLQKNLPEVGDREADWTFFNGYENRKTRSLYLESLR